MIDVTLAKCISLVGETEGLTENLHFETLTDELDDAWLSKPFAVPSYIIQPGVNLFFTRTKPGPGGAPDIRFQVTDINYDTFSGEVTLIDTSEEIVIYLKDLPKGEDVDLGDVQEFGAAAMQSKIAEYLAEGWELFTEDDDDDN